MSINIVILGDGISAQLFLSYLKYHASKDYSCLIIEKKAKAGEEHIDDVPFYFNRIIDDFANLFVPITIKMGIYDKGEVIYQGNADLANKYAVKILGFHSNNTISFIEKEKRAYVIRNSNGNLGRKMTLYNELHKINSNYQYLYDTEIVRIDAQNKKLYSSTGDEFCYDFLVSTIPLSNLNDIVGECHWADAILNSYPFFINRFHVRADNKYQVLYCVDNDIRFSRMAKLNDTIYMESRDKIDFKYITPEELKFVNLIFDPIYAIEKSYIIYPGRFKQIEDDDFKKIKEEYRKSSIFLLGRMATWRFKLIEDIYMDCKELCEWIC